MNPTRKYDDEDLFDRFASRSEEPVERLKGTLAWLGSFLVLLVLAVASFNAHAQLPDPGMTIDPARTAGQPVFKVNQQLRNQRNSS